MQTHHLDAGQRRRRDASSSRATTLGRQLGDALHVHRQRRVDGSLDGLSGPATGAALGVTVPVGRHATVADWRSPTPSQSSSSVAPTVTSPNGGESWPVNGSLQTVKWTPGDGGDVAIELSRDNGGSWETLFASTANDGSQSWTVSGPATSQALVRISNAIGSDVSSADFTIGSGFATRVDYATGISPLLGRRRRLQRRRQARPGGGQLQPRHASASCWATATAPSRRRSTMRPDAPRSRSPSATSTATASRTWRRPTSMAAPSASCWATATAPSRPTSTTRPAASRTRSPSATSTATASRTWRWPTAAATASASCWATATVPSRPRLDYATGAAPVLRSPSATSTATASRTSPWPTRTHNTVSVLLGDGDGTFAAKIDYATGRPPGRRSLSATSTATASRTWRWPTTAPTASASCWATATAPSRPRSTIATGGRARSRSPSMTSTATASRTWAAKLGPRHRQRPAGQRRRHLRGQGRLRDRRRPGRGRRRRLQRRRQAGPGDGQRHREHRQRAAQQPGVAAGPLAVRRPGDYVPPRGASHSVAPATSTATASRTWRPPTSTRQRQRAAGERQWHFGAMTDYAPAVLPHSVAVGDFNGDGKQDLATANLSGDTSACGWGTATVVSGQDRLQYRRGTTPFRHRRRLQRDGKQDLAGHATAATSACCWATATVPSRPRSTTRPEPPPLGRRRRLQPRRQAGPGDGQQRTTDGISVLMGTGPVPSPTRSSTGPVMVRMLGRRRRLQRRRQAGHRDGQLLRKRERPAGTERRLRRQDDYTVGVCAGVSIAVGDFNGDGKQDLATASTSAGTISVVLGDRRRQLRFPYRLCDRTGSSVHALAAADFNRDGKLDLATAIAPASCSTRPRREVSWGR